MTGLITLPSYDPHRFSSLLNLCFSVLETISPVEREQRSIFAEKEISKMSDIFRRRTVRTLITRLSLTPQEAGKEYVRNKYKYDRVADYHWPETTWEDAQDEIVRVYHWNKERQW